MVAEPGTVKSISDEGNSLGLAGGNERGNVKRFSFYLEKLKTSEGHLLPIGGPTHLRWFKTFNRM